MFHSTLRRLRALSSTARGAIDLASVMIGVIVIGVIGGIITATVFTVIPWGQDSAARTSLDAVHYSESVAYAQNLSIGQPRFDNFEELTGKELLPDRVNVVVETSADGQCYLGIVQSATGTYFFITYEVLEPEALVEDTVNGCVSPEAAWALAESLNE